jgi:Protein of unknown function (DUF2934)
MQTQKVKSEDAIRTIAHDLWEAEGRPEGRAEQHWQRAVDSLSAPVSAKAEAATPKKKPAAKAAKKN